MRSGLIPAAGSLREAGFTDAEDCQKLTLMISYDNRIYDVFAIVPSACSFSCRPLLMSIASCELLA